MKRWEARTNHVSWALTAATGLVFGVFKYFVTNPDANSRAPHPWASPFLAAHLLAAPAAVFALGLVFRRHALARLASGQKEGRSTGRLLAWLAIPVAMSGYVVQVVTHEPSRRWIGYGHAVAGLLFAVGFFAHPRTGTNGYGSVDADRERSGGDGDAGG